VEFIGLKVNYEERKIYADNYKFKNPYIDKDEDVIKRLKELYNGSKYYGKAKTWDWEINQESFL
jgi:hypothetical protein